MWQQSRHTLVVVHQARRHIATPRLQQEILLMNPGFIASSALASVLALGLLSGAQAQERAGEKEKCFGISKAGQNDCANTAGTHSCAGQSKVDLSVDDWKFVAKGTCAKMGGKSAQEAKAATQKK